MRKPQVFQKLVMLGKWKSFQVFESQKRRWDEIWDENFGEVKNMKFIHEKKKKRMI